MWVVSPWVSDIQVLDNSFGGFGGLFATAKPRLSDVLHTLAAKGTSIVLVAKDVETNRPFVQSLESIRSRLPVPGKLAVRLDNNSRLHTKAIVSEGYVVSGSMNFTRAGTMLNDELIELRTESAYVAESRIAAQALYGGSL